MKAKAYSTRKIRSINVASIVTRRDGQAVWVGVDVSKDDLRLVLRWPDRSFDRPISVDNPTQIPLAIEFLKRVEQGRALVIALEPSGTYGDAFRQACHDAALVVHRINPKAAHDYAEVFDGVPSQHDGKDAAVNAELAAIGKSCEWLFKTPAERDQRLALQADRVDYYMRAFAACCGRLEAWLARHWPEITSVVGLSSRTLLKALARYGSPAALSADPEAAARLREFGGMLLKEQTLGSILEAARTTVGVRCSSVDVEQVQFFAQEAMEVLRKDQACRRALRALSAGDEVIERMKAVVGPVTACVLYTRVGAPRNYWCGRAYLKALGLNLTERSSGRYKGEMKISKRGPSQARQWLYFAALRMVQEPGVADWYAQKVAKDGGKRKRALVGVMRKLGLALHQVDKFGTTFDPQRLFAGTLSRVNRRAKKLSKRSDGAKDALGHAEARLREELKAATQALTRRVVGRPKAGI